MGDPEDTENTFYTDLKALRNKILLQFENNGNGIIDVNDWFRKQGKLLPKFIWEQLSEVLPASKYVVRGFLLESDILHRNNPEEVRKLKSSGEIEKKQAQERSRPGWRVEVSPRSRPGWRVLSPFSTVFWFFAKTIK